MAFGLRGANWVGSNLVHWSEMAVAEDAEQLSRRQKRMGKGQKTEIEIEVGFTSDAA